MYSDTLDELMSELMDEATDHIDPVIQAAERVLRDERLDDYELTGLYL